MNRSPDIVLKPIGVVRSPIKEVSDDGWGGVAATIALDSQLFGPESTQGLDQFSHVKVIFLLNKIPAESLEKARGIRADAPIGRKWESSRGALKTGLTASASPFANFSLSRVLKFASANSTLWTTHRCWM
jgi:tRNA (Thr-GGU) A37 N-methylase